MFTNNKPVLFTFLAIAALLLLAAISVALEKPVGAIQGTVSMEEEGFSLSTRNIRGNKVYALAIGPRGAGAGPIIERGVWVQPDGTFQINHLPIGEYTLRVRMPGYSTHHQHGLYVAEGEVTQANSANLTILNPSVNIASNSRVFTTRQKPTFWINASGATRAKVNIYKRDFMSLLTDQNNPLQFDYDFGLYKPNQKPAELFGDDKPVVSFSRKLEPDIDDWARAEFALDDPLPPGDYVAVVEAYNPLNQQNWNLMGFSVTNLGLILKQAPEKTVVRAMDLNTMKPRAGVTVKLFDKGEGLQLVGTLTTGKDGFDTMPMPADREAMNSYTLLAYGTQGQDRAYGGIPYWRGYNDRYHTYFYTERPVYRLGQTVYFKGITRILDKSGFRNPKGSLALDFAIEDPSGNVLREGKLQTNAYGSFHGTFDIPADGKTGAYAVSITYPDGSHGYEAFEVAQYRKPEYQVEVTPLEPRVVGGSNLKARIKASYYFGAPVANARVKYSVYASTDWNSRFQAMQRSEEEAYYDDWADSDYDSGYAGDYITEGYAKTDEKGEAIIEFKTRKPQLPSDGPFGSDYMDKRYKIQAEVTDLSRMSVIGSGNASVTAGEFLMLVQPERYVYKSGESLVAEVTAMDYDGKPRANQTVEVSLMRWQWNSRQESYKAETLKSGIKATTNAQGKAQITLQPPANQLETDNYLFAVKAKDSHGHTLYDEAGVWIASAQSPYYGADPDAESMSIVPDKKVYKPGETAKVMVTAPVTGKEGYDAIIALESNQLHRYWTIPLDATAKLVEIPLTDDYAPNVDVTVTFVGKNHQFYSQSHMLKVSPKQHFLNIAVETDKSTYKPGESVTYTIKATYPDGRPAGDTEISLGVVDESIYAIRPDPSPDIRKFFYHERANWVLTVSSFPEEYSGGPDKTEPRIRKNFKDMAAWLPSLITDANGIARATITLPDNLTTWRATVKAISAHTDVGSAIQKVTATKDILVRLALPRFFTVNDKGLLTAIVHNYTRQDQQVRLALEISPQLNVDRKLAQTLTVKADEAKRFSWPVKLVDAGEATVTIKAVGETDGDALSLNVPVNPMGIAMADVNSGVLRLPEDKATIPVKLPASVLPQKAVFQLALSASSIGPVLGSFGSLIDYPYGCTEQTMSRLMPSIIAIRLNQTLGIPLSSSDRARFYEVYHKSIAILYDYQQGDGGWGWWAYDDSDPYLTAYVMEGFYLLQQAGFSVDNDRIRRGREWMNTASKRLAEQLHDPMLVKNTYNYTEAVMDLAHLQYVRSLYGEKVDPVLQAWMLAHLNEFTPEGLSYLTLAFTAQHNQKAAQDTYKALMDLANKTNTTLDWDHTASLMKRLFPNREQFYTYRYTGVESTALALRAAVAYEPANTERLEAIKSWLLMHRNQSGWDNTKTTAMVLRALMAEELVSRHQDPTLFEVAVLLEEETSHRSHFSSSNQYDPEQTLTLPVQDVVNRTLSLVKSGTGRLFYQGLLTYVLPLKPGDTVPHKALPEGLSIRREFFRLHPTVTTSDGKVHFKAVPLKNNTVKAGETILMKIVIDSPITLPYVIVESALPSGGEVVSNDPRLNLLDQGGGEDEPFWVGNWGQWWWSHQDILDDRVVFFTHNLPQKQSEFHALVRMEMPGTFYMNPSRLEGMYTKNVRAYSTLDSITVVE